MNPTSEWNCHDTLQVTCLHVHWPNYYSNLYVTLFFVKHISSIQLFKEQLCQVNKLLVDCCYQFNNFAVEWTCVHLGTKFDVLIIYFIEN